MGFGNSFSVFLCVLSNDFKSTGILEVSILFSSPLSHLKCWKGLRQRYVVFTYNELMDVRTEFEPVGNHALLSFSFHCHETVLVEGYPPQDPLAVSNLRSHYLILLPDLLCISYFLLLTLVAVIKTSTRCVV